MGLKGGWGDLVPSAPDQGTTESKGGNTLKRVRSFAMLVGAASLLVASALPAHATTTWSRNVKIPITASLDVDGSGCTNHPGPYIKLGGTFRIGGLDVVLKLDNNVNKPGQHELQTDPVASSLVVSSLTKTTFAKQPPLGGVTGNPAIYVQLLNGSTPVTDPVYVGRCQGGSKKHINASFSSPSLLQLIASSLDCNNGGGNQITFGGDWNGTTGISALITLKGGNGKFTDQTVGTVKAELTGAIGPFSKKGSDPNGVTGNPWVSLAPVVDGVIGAYTDPVKCNKL